MIELITLMLLVLGSAATPLDRSEAIGANNEGFRQVNLSPTTPAVVHFPLTAVHLTEGSLYEVAQTRNLEFQLSLNTSQLLCEFTSAANLTSCIKTNGDECATSGDASMPLCNPLPGEMGPGGYYGHYLGHYLSGNAMLYNNTQDQRVLAKGKAIVDGLRGVAAAWTASHVPNSNGYIFPYYPDVFGIMETRCGMSGPTVDYSVPYYTLHKIMAGLLDQALLAHNADAYALVLGLADWTVARVAQTLTRGGERLWQCVLGTEWGGMNEVMYNVYASTGTEAYLCTAKLFNHWQWTAPLAIGLDDLDGSHGNTGGNHANTHIPEIIGAARGYELTGNTTQRAIAVNFFSLITAHHSWATAGSNDGEHWGAPDRMGDFLNADTEESCTQYNILKVARHLFEWTGDSHLGDFYERAILNGILGNQNKEDPAMTSFIYMLPLGAGGMHKPWGKSNDGFPCCWGTLTEQFSKMADSIFFTDPTHTTLVVQQFMSATVHWAARNITVEQVAQFPFSTSRTTTITVVSAVASTDFTLKIRVPSWADGANSVTVNGVPVAGVQRGSFLAITRTWARGDTVECFFPLSLWTSPVQDTRPEYNETVAYMYGPLVLAGLTQSAVFRPPPHCSVMQPSAFIARNASTATLAFVATGTDDLGNHVAMPMMPLFTVVDEAYAVYFRSQPATPVTYSAGGASVPSATNADWDFVSASIVPSRLPTVSDMRTSGPHCTSRLTLAHPIEGQGHSIARVSFSFQYVAGYDAANGTWPVLSAELTNAATGATVKALWQSDPLDKYQYDDFKGYSPPVHVTTTGNLNVPNSDALFLSLTVINGDHNVQIPIDTTARGLNVSIHWNTAPSGYTHRQWFVHDAL